MIFRLWAVLIFTGIFSIPPVFSADFYKWTDEEGAVHFAGSLSDIPEQYREAVLGGEFKKEGKLSFSSSPPDQDIEPASPGESPQASQPSPPRQYAVRYQSSEGSARRVIIDVTFNDRVTVPVLFDTGAFETIIFPDLAHKLGLFEHDTPKLSVAVGGVGGSAPAIRAILESMRVGGFKNTFVPIKITEGLSDAFQAIVGLDFISNYSVRISPLEKTVIFEEIQTEKPLYGGHDETWWRNYFSEFEAYRSEWLQWRDALKKALDQSQFKIRWEREAVENELLISNYHYAASDRLLGEINSYANTHAVPVDWRRPAHHSKK